MKRKGRFAGMQDPPDRVSGIPDEQQTPADELEGHGKLHTGFGQPPPGGMPLTSRPHIWIWLEPDREPGCGQYRWYQYFKPEFYILEDDDLNPDGTRSEDAEPETNLPELIPVTGTPFRFNRWNPDFHKDEIAEEDRRRRADGLPSLPTFRPAWLRPPAGGPKKAKPFVQYGVPGTNPDGTTRLPGLLDGPNFSERSDADDKSTVEFAFLRKIRPREATGQRPPAGQAICEVAVEFRTCLLCIDNDAARCLRCLTWTYTERSTLRTEWVVNDTVSATPELGSSEPPEPRWKLAARVIATVARIDVGGWGPCGG